MKYLKVVLFALVITFCNNIYAQNVPADLIGKWKIVNVYAVDSLENILVGETASLKDDLVNNSVVEYEFTDSTFTLYMNSVPSGTCSYVIGGNEGNSLIFDANAVDLSDIVNDLVGLELSATDLHLRASSPDEGSEIKFHEFLVKQP